MASSIKNLNRNQLSAYILELTEIVRTQMASKSDNILSNITLLKESLSNFRQILDDVIENTEGLSYAELYKRTDPILQNIKALQWNESIDFDLQAIDIKVKAESVVFLPPDLPRKPKPRSTFVESIYDFYKKYFWPLDKFLLGKSVVFRVQRALSYHIFFYLLTKLEDDFENAQNLHFEVTQRFSEALDILKFTFSEENDEDVRSEKNILKLNSGVRKRIDILFDSSLMSLKNFEVAHRNNTEQAIFQIGINLDTESQLAGTSVEEILWYFRRIELINLRLIHRIQKLIKVGKKVDNHSKEIADNVPKILKKLQRRINLTEEPSSFIRQMDFFIPLPEDLEGILTLQPVSSHSFWGRDEEIRILHNEYSNFRSGGRIAVSISGEVGIGRHSLINKVSKNWKNTTTLEFNASVKSIKSLSELLRNHINPDAISLDDAMASDDKRIIIVHGIEYLYEREVGGFEVIKRFMEILAKSQERIFWIICSNSLAFEFLDGVFGFSRLFKVNISLKNLKPPELQEMLMHRLHFSGYRFTFMDSKSSSKKKINDQKKLRKLYFERLHDISGGNPLSAIYFMTMTIQPLSESRLVLNVIPEARFDQLARATLEEKFIFYRMIEQDEIECCPEASSLNRIILLAKSLQIVVQVGNKLSIVPQMRPLVIKVLRDSGIIE